MGNWKRKNKNKRINNAGRKQNQANQANPSTSRAGQFGGPHNNHESGYTPAWQTNRRMEAYYAYQGMHDLTWNAAEGGGGGVWRECVSDDEKTKEALIWMQTCKRILPASFRIGVDVDPIIRERLEKELHDMVGTEMELVLDDPTATADGSSNNSKTVKLAPAKRIPFVPHAYQLAVDRHTIRKNESLKVLFEWLKVQTQAGFVTRQETVSMIPPVVMNVQPHYQVLDMCAAPGSKTTQLLEVVSTIPPGEREPVGCVVANDADPKRAYMLVHQLKRIHSPVSIVTSCDAQFFPLLKTPEDKDLGKEGMFDAVLADVPCSGDGTMRKNPGVWKKWSALNSYGLHPLQLSIAMNGARLTKVGGHLCYSTCSMSPIENEAVVAELLRSTDGALELVDRRADLEEIKGRPGWSDWKVLREEKSIRRSKNEQKKHNKKMKERRAQFKEHGKATWNDGEAKEGDEATTTEATTTATETGAATTTETGAVTKDDVKTGAETKANGEETAETTTAVADDGVFQKEVPHNKPLGPPASWDAETLKARCTAEGMTEYTSYDDVEEDWQKTLRKSVFCPTPEEAASMNLEKCMRFLPHDMDTSGFFVALFKKVHPLSTRARSKAAALATELRHDIVDATGQEKPKEAKVLPPKKKMKLNDGEEFTIEDAPMEAEESNETGGEATEETKSVEEEGAASSSDAAAATGEPPLAKIVKGKINYSRGNSAPKGNMGNENFVLVNKSNLIPLKEYFGMPDDFPMDQYMSRANGDSKVMYFIGKAVKNIMAAGLQERVTIINSGLKAFERNSHECGVRHRVTQEGIHYLAPYMTNRKFAISTIDFIKCLRAGAIPITAFSAEFGEMALPLSVGSFVVALKGYENDTAKKLIMVMWKCRADNVNCLVAKIEKDGMKSKLRAITGEELPDEEEEEIKKAQGAICMTLGAKAPKEDVTAKKEEDVVMLDDAKKEGEDVVAA